jgi:Ice-binding-like
MPLTTPAGPDGQASRITTVDGRPGAREGARRKGTGAGVWVFQIGTGLTTATSQVVMANGGLACNVYWVPGTFATIGTDMKFQGNILAGSAVNFTGTNSSLVGRALAKTKVALTGTHARLPSNWNTSACLLTP